MLALSKSPRRCRYCAALAAAALAVIAWIQFTLYRRVVRDVLFVRQHAERDAASFLSRFDHPARALDSVGGPAPRAERRNRVLLSSIPEALSDGLGHRLAMVMFEMRLAELFGLGYAHRVSRYGSLTPHGDRLAVERLFGWLGGLETRMAVLSHSCAEVVLAADNCERARRLNVVCRRLRPRSAGGQFAYLVAIPPAVIDCFAQARGRAITACAAAARAFFEAHDAPDTAFQMTPHLCHTGYGSVAPPRTRAFLLRRYWAYHGRYGASRKRARDPPPGFEVPGRRTSRVLALDPRRLQVAVHVRRGDFFNYTGRQMVPDAVYADVVGAVARAAGSALQAPPPLDVHVFSEGVARSGRIKDNHNVRAMRPAYVSNAGKEMPPGYWQRLVAARVGPSARVFERFASDTVPAIHDMIAADFFVGSRSGLSGLIVSMYARGVVLLPQRAGRGIGIGEQSGVLLYAYNDRENVGAVNLEKLRDRVEEAFDKFQLRCVLPKNCR